MKIKVEDLIELLQHAHSVGRQHSEEDHRRTYNDLREAKLIIESFRNQVREAECEQNS